MSNKTPFEIRLETLQLAQSILNDRVWAERQTLEQSWNIEREIAFEMWKENGKAATIPVFPVLPSVTSEEIIAEAKKLNDFISNG